MTLEEAKAAVEAAGLGYGSFNTHGGGVPFLSIHNDGDKRNVLYRQDGMIEFAGTIHEAIAAAKGEIARAPDAFDSRLIDATSELSAAVKGCLCERHNLHITVDGFDEDAVSVLESTARLARAVCAADELLRGELVERNGAV